MHEMIEEIHSMVIDLTYRCNAHCQYCQWGSKDSRGADLELEKILLPKEILESMNINKIVFSGGEPLLHKNFEAIVRYYVEMGMKQLVLISNGILISKLKLLELLNLGINGITVSFDSIDEQVANAARGMSELQHKKVVQNIRMISEYKQNHNSFEFGINVTLSKVNIEKKSVVNTIAFLNDLNLDFVKFQPIFNDGYVENNAPELLFDKDNSEQILDVGKYITRNLVHRSNPFGFYKTINYLLKGAVLDGNTCGIDSNQSIFINDKVKFCYWMDDPTYGKITDNFSTEYVKSTVKDFLIKKNLCKTNMYCFCLQKIDHTWRVIKREKSG